MTDAELLAALHAPCGLSPADDYKRHMSRAHRDLSLHMSAFAREVDILNTRWHLKQALSIASKLKDRHAISSVLRVMSWLRSWEAQQERLYHRWSRPSEA